MDTTSEMAAFVAVVEAGGFSPAARRLGLTHSAVSKKVKRLEDRLGTQLLTRTTRHVALTEAGANYSERATCILRDIELMDEAVGSIAATPHGTVRVSASNAFGQLRIVPALAEFRALYPDVRIDLHLTDAMADLVGEGFDLAIRSAVLVDSSLIARRLTSNDRIICAAPEYLARHGEPAAADELSTHNCLTLNIDGRFNEWEFRSSKTPRVRVQGSFACNSVESLHVACLTGLGIARLPEFLVAGDVADGRLIRVLDETRLPSASAVHAVRPPGEFAPAKVRAFLDFLIERFDPAPPLRRTSAPAP